MGEKAPFISKRRIAGVGVELIIAGKSPRLSFLEHLAYYERNTHAKKKPKNSVNWKIVRAMLDRVSSCSRLAT